MDVQHVVDAVLYMAGLPLEANVQFIQTLAEYRRSLAALETAMGVNH